MGYTDDFLTMDEIEGAAAELAGRFNALRGTGATRADIMNAIHEGLRRDGSGYSVTELSAGVIALAREIEAEERGHSEALGLTATDGELHASATEPGPDRAAVDREVARLVAKGAHPARRPASRDDIPSTYPVRQPDDDGEPSESAEDFIGRMQVDGTPGTRALFTRPDGTDWAAPARGGVMHPGVARLMHDHNGRDFGRETPRSGNQAIRAGGALVAMTAPSPSPFHGAGQR